MWCTLPIRPLRGVALGIIAAFASFSAAQTIHIIPTWGPPPVGDDISHAYDLSSNGGVVVGMATAASGQRPYRWTPGGGLQDLGLLSGITDAHAYAVSADGNFIVGDGPGANEAWRWTPGGGLVSFGLPGSTARGVSSNGVYVAGTSSAGFYRWTSAGGFQNLGVYPGTTQGVCLGISPDGSTLFGQSGLGVFGPTNHAVKWNATAGWTDLGLNPEPGANYARGLAASTDGTFIVGESNFAFPTFIHAVRWNNTTFEDLGIPPNATVVTPFAISSDGTFVAGTIQPQSGATRAFVWTETFGFEDLDQYLLAQGVDISAWAQFYEVRAISDDNTALCGWGRIAAGLAPRAFVVRGLKPVCGPRITEQPQSQVTCVGGSTSMFVDAFGPTLFFPQFQWQKRGNDGEWNDLPNMTSPWGSVFAGTNTSVIHISNCSPIDVPGMYRCVVSAGCATIPTTVVTIALINQIPTLTGQPTDMAVCPGDSGTFSVGPPTPPNGPYTYQWERETTPNSNIFVPLTGGFTYSWDGNVPGYGGIVSGTLSPTLTLAPDTGNGRILGPAHNRAYRCVVSNACGAVASLDAGLKVFTSCILGDLNCDGVVSVADIGAFVLLLTNPAQFEAQFPHCNPDNGDLNDDGFITVGDIGPFVALLTGG